MFTKFQYLNIACSRRSVICGANRTPTVIIGFLPREALL